MNERQSEFGFDFGFSPPPAAAPELRDEIADVWGLPLGRRVEVCFRGAERSAIVGTLELLASPGYPWDPREPLRLHISGCVFSSREIGSWTLL